MYFFRDDIQGVRGIAILAVVLFHFFPNLLPNGFFGVDLFFVISGYLMTIIIIKDLIKNNFSFLNFYLKKFNENLSFNFIIVVNIFNNLLFFFTSYRFKEFF